MSESIKRYFKIGDKLKKIRLDMKMNQTAFSEMLGITRSTYSNYENNNRVPDEKTLNKISSVLDIPLNDLLGISSTRSEFEHDFDIKIFDDEVISYINNLKKSLKKISPDGVITNTLVMQNILIDRIADETAQKILKMYPMNSLFLEFSMDKDGNILTGQKLKGMLIDKYKNKYIDMKIDRLKKDFSYISQLEGDTLESIKKHYEDIPKHLIPKYITEKLYPEFLKEREEIEANYKEMKKQNEEHLRQDGSETDDFAGYYEDVQDHLNK